MGKETAPALTLLPSDQFDRFYNAAVALSRASEDTYRVKQVAKAANLKVAQQALYKAQEEEIKDLKKENDSLRSWKNHTYDYDELENKVTKLEKTVDVLKSVATKMFRFIKNLVFNKNGEETDGLDELKDATDIMDDPEEKEMFEEIENDATRKHGLWFL